MKRTLLVLMTMVFIALHQDSWFWREAHPLVLGILPPGLWYHALYTLAAAVLMAVLVAFEWPRHLETDDTVRGR
jgi:Protein of unknown function (DUF3311)